MAIKINIAEKRAVVEGAPVIVCGNSSYSIEFTFDAEWDSVTNKKARFIYTRDGVVQHEDVPFTGTTVAVPFLVGIRSVEVGVFTEGENLCTTTPAKICCTPSILCEAGQVAIPGGTTADTDEKEIFIAEYGVTTYEELETAYNAGKALFCRKDIYVMPLYSHYPDSSFSFCVITTTQRLNYYITAADKKWTGLAADLCGPKFTEIEESIGDIDAALDGIIAIQNELIGGDEV